MGLLVLTLAAAITVLSAGSAERGASARTLGAARLESPLRGFVTFSLGPRRGLLLTRDGGRTWKNVAPARISGAIYDWAWLGSRYGWIVTSDCVGKGGVVVHRTANGGRTWHRSRRLTHLSCNAGNWLQLAFADTRRGWLFQVETVRHVAALWRTVDGGRTWSSSARLPLRGAVAFTSTRDGWLARGRWRDQQAFFTTHDGGRTWSRRRFARPNGYGGAETYYAVPTFFGARGVLPVTLLTPRRAAVAFYVTADAGKTWRLEALRRVVLAWRPHNPFAWHAPTAIAAPRTWWLASGRRVERVEVTTDGGRSWRRIDDRVVRGDFASISAAGRSAWIQTGRFRYRLFATSNAGRTWRRLDP
jgi:photosystem II stability/assembly factor-like uncharacterized protein